MQDLDSDGQLFCPLARGYPWVGAITRKRNRSVQSALIAAAPRQYQQDWGMRSFPLFVQARGRLRGGVWQARGRPKMQARWAVLWLPIPMVQKV